MSTLRFATVFCGAVAFGACIVMLAILLRSPASNVVLPEVPAVQRQPIPQHDSVVVQLVRAAESSPFRADRRPPVSGGSPVATAALEAAQAPKPPLALAGLIRSARSTAIVEGIPNAARSSVLGVGQALGGVTLKRVTQEGATLTGYDTTWFLRLRELE